MTRVITMLVANAVTGNGMGVRRDLAAAEHAPEHRERLGPRGDAAGAVARSRETAVRMRQRVSRAHD